MGLEKCPKCGKKSFIKTPSGSIRRESLGCMINVSDSHYWQCLHSECKYKTEIKVIKTKAGEYFDLPWYKRIFKTF
jgi:predicted nucleic-acid-binding Zn-ribbon protein